MNPLVSDDVECHIKNMLDADVKLPAPAKLRRYALFISYRHADNLEMGRKWATWLHEAVENYEIPGDLIATQNLRGEAIPQSLYPVFRDEEELPADADLSNNIRRALENSSLLVVICSPRAVQSRFVADEIRYFKELGRSGRILALIIDGEPNASDDPEKMVRLGTSAECFPEPLRFGVPNEHGIVDWSARTEPIAADCRPGGRPIQGWTTVAAYEAWLETQPEMNNTTTQQAVREYSERLELAKLKVIAGALGVPLGELTRRDKARQLLRAKKRARILTSLSVLFALLAGVAVVMGWMANERRKDADFQRSEADKQRVEANLQREQAVLRRVEADQARLLADEEKSRAVTTLAISDLQEGLNRLANTDSARVGMAYLARSARAGHTAAATRIWTLLQEETFLLPTTAPTQPPPVGIKRMKTQPIPKLFQSLDLDGERVKPTWYSESADGERCVTVVSIADSGDGPITFRVWEKGGRPLGPWREVEQENLDHYLYEISAAVLSNDGRFLAVIAKPWRAPQYIEVWDVDNGKRIEKSLAASGTHANFQEAEYNDVWFTPSLENRSGPKLVTLSSRGDAKLYQIHDYDENSEIGLVATNSHGQPITLGDVGHGHFISYAIDGSIRVSSSGDGESVGWPVAAEIGVIGLRIDSEDGFSVRGKDSKTAAWRIQGPTRLPNSSQTHLTMGKDQRGLHKIWDESTGKDPVVADQLGEKVLEIVGSVELQLKQNGNQTPIWNRKFNAPIVHARFIKEQEVLVQTDFFTTEIWDTTKDSLKYPAIRESTLFRQGEASDTVLLSSISSNERYILTRSFRWIPPNLGIYAFTIWDVMSGKPLSKRYLIGDSDDHAEFSKDTSHVLYGLSYDEDPKDVTSSLQLVPPIAVMDRVGDLAEALGGFRIRDDGNITEVEGDPSLVLSDILKAINKE